MIEIKSVILILFCYYFCSNDSTIAAFTFYRHSTTNVYDNRNVIKNREWQRKGELYAFNDGGVLISSNMNNANDRNSGVEKLPKVLPNGGRVTLVGSGPGDPELLTLSAYKLLTNEDDESNCADEIIVDRLVSKEILDLIPSTKVVRIAKKYPGCAEQAQQEIYSWVENAVQKGKHVVRLKIGDPFVFGRGGEEVLKFRSFGVEPHVIPGVSAAFSAPLLGSIPVTHRGVSNQVVMCTGYGRNNTSPDLIQYHKEQTVVFLMAVGRLEQLSNALIEKANFPPLTPVAIIQEAGCPSQRTVVGNLQTIASLAKEHNVKPPSTIVVGDVVNVLLETDEQSGQAISGLIQNMTAAHVV